MAIKATKRTRRLRLLLLVLAGAAAPLPAAEAFDARVLDSVVSVLPDWSAAPAGAGPGEEPEGSAVAIRAGGYLVTNDHVLGRAATVQVRLADGRILAAEVVGRDGRTDLAVLRIAADLPVLPVAPEPALGDPVCTVGNQFGLGLSVTCGVVSATHRTGVGFNPVEDFVQTDAVVNPGASGGALVDAQGRLVGILSAIFTKESDANIGVNFAASMPLVQRVVGDLITHKRVRRASSGLRVGDLSRDERRTGAGARVLRVVPGSPAEAAGVKAGDVLTAVGERPVRHASDVPSAMHRFRPGDRVALSVLRDGAPLTLFVELAP